MDAKDLKALLVSRHSSDIFVPECPCCGFSRRLDAWALRDHTAIGYEVKVDRGDFRSDTKWREYLPYCHEFYFVCPADLIDKGELPGEAGLIWATRNASRLYIKKKAPTRAVAIPDDLWIWLLNRPDRSTGVSREDRMLSYRAQIAEAERRKELAYFVAQHIRTRIAEVEHESRMAKAVSNGLEAFRAELVAAGIEPEYLTHRHSRRSELAKLREDLPHDIDWTLEQAETAIAKIREQVTAIKADRPQPQSEAA